MKVLLKQAQIVCSNSPFNGQSKDILIDDGIILSIKDKITDDDATIIAEENLHVSLGWMDIFADFADPGYEHRETIQSGASAAAAGGFTDVMVLPNTKPVVHNKSQVEYLIQQSKHVAVTIYPIGAVTKDTEGKELAEMYDMQHSGAIAFSDGINTIQNGGLLVKALQYIKPFNGTIIQIPEDKSIGINGLMNEGIISTRLGLPGKPTIAEELLVTRDIKLSSYSNSKLHFTGITTAKTLQYIREAKNEGIAISCSVTPYHLFFCDDALQQYDTNLKVNPPIRTDQDRTAILAALIDGSVDCIASHHIPQHADDKICEFEYAKPGMIGLETLFGVVWSLVNTYWTINQLIEKLTIAPRKLFNINIPEITEGSIACLTLFNPATSYQFTYDMIQSKSKNSAFIGKQLKGSVIGIINKNKLVLNK